MCCAACFLSDQCNQCGWWEGSHISHHATRSSECPVLQRHTVSCSTASVLIQSSFADRTVMPVFGTQFWVTNQHFKRDQITYCVPWTSQLFMGIMNSVISHTWVATDISQANCYQEMDLKDLFENFIVWQILSSLLYIEHLNEVLNSVGVLN